MNGYTAAWLLWAAMFVVIEGASLVDKDKGDTLSEHLRSWFATRDKPRGWQIRRLVLAGFFVWFIPHLFLGI